MEYFRFYLLMLMAIAFGGICCKEAEKAKPDERFLDLDSFFDGFEDNVKNLASQGQQAMQTVQEIKGQHGTHVTKTVISHTFTSGGSGIPGNFPVGDRFKRSLFDGIASDVSSAADKLTGVLADGINISYEGMKNIKEKIRNKLEN